MAKGPAHGKCQMHFWTDSKILWQLCLDTTAIWVPLGNGDDPGNCFLWICGWRYNNTSRGCGPFMMEALCWFFRRKKKLLCLTLWVLGEVEVSLSLSLELSGTQLYCHVRLEVKKKKKKCICTTSKCLIVWKWENYRILQKIRQLFLNYIFVGRFVWESLERLRTVISRSQSCVYGSAAAEKVVWAPELIWGTPGTMPMPTRSGLVHTSMFSSPRTCQDA